MRTQTGLTLIELMVTLVVAIVLTALGLPVFDRIHGNNRVATQSNALVSALTTARLEALSRGLPVAVCAKASVSPADSTCGNATDWANGWQVFLDTGATPGNFDAATEQRLQVFDALSGDPEVTASTGFLRFAGDGALDGNLHATAESFRVTQLFTQAHHNCIRVNVVGQLRANRITAAESCP